MCFNCWRSSDEANDIKPFLTGFYCPLGSLTPLPCPEGTYGPTAGAESVDSCLQCPPHHYCPGPGLPAPRACGPGAHQPLSAQESCTCLGEGQNFQVTPSYHVTAAQSLMYHVCRRTVSSSYDLGFRVDVKLE